MALTKVVTNAITDDAVTAAKIADGTIVAADLAANSVDSAAYVDGSIDLAHMSVNSIDSDQYVDGSIDLAHMSVNSIDSDQYVDGSIDTAHIANDQITAALIADNAIDSDMYVDGSIDNAHIADDAIDSEHYAAGSIDTAHIAADQIVASLIADNAIDSEHYTDGSIDNAHIADDAIDSEHYAAGSIDEAHIADDAVTLAKMDGLARGKIIYGNASGNPTALTVGSSGQALVSDGTDISWGSGGAISTYSNSTNNRVITSVDSSSVNSEANLTFDGSTLAVTGAATISTTLAVTGIATFTGVPVLPANTIDSAHYVDGSIDNAHIADDAIDSEHYADGSIDNAHIADDAIDSEHYADGSIDEAHIANAAVAIAKMKIESETQLSEAPATGDELVIYDASASANRRINVSNFLKAQKVLQVVKTNLASSGDSTSNSFATILTSSTITLASASNSLLCIVNFNYKLRGNNSVTTPEGYIQLQKADGTALSTHMAYFSGLSGDQGRMDAAGCLIGIYSPSGTSEAPRVQYKADQGAFEVKGLDGMLSSAGGSVTSITVMEIGA